MSTKPHFFASHHFDRMAYRRDQDTWLEERRSSGTSWFLPVAASKNLVLLDANELALRACAICNNWYPHDILGLRPLKCPGCRVLKLG